MIALKLVGLVMLYAFVAWSLLRPVRKPILDRAGHVPAGPSLRLAAVAHPAARAQRAEDRPSLAPYRSAA